MSIMHRKTGITLLFLLLALSTLTGCHGKGGQKSFSIPEQLDTSRQYEITFWAKNDTNKTQTDIYKKAITDFQTLYRTSLLISVCIRIMEKFIMMLSPILPRIPRPTYASPTPTISPPI